MMTGSKERDALAVGARSLCEPKAKGVISNSNEPRNSNVEESVN